MARSGDVQDGRKVAPAFSALPPSLAVVCRGAKDGQERRCTRRQIVLLGNCPCVALISYIRVTMHFLHFRHPWWSYAAGPGVARSGYVQGARYAAGPRMARNGDVQSVYITGCKGLGGNG